MEPRSTWWNVLRGVVLLSILMPSSLPAAEEPALDVAVEPVIAHELVLDVTAFGADPSGTTSSTEAFAEAIGQAAEAGGGRVVVPAGTFTVTGIALRSRVHLALDDAAVIRASDRSADYPGSHPLVTAKDAEHVAITGGGSLVSSGFWRYDPPSHRPRNGEHGTTSVIRLTGCRQVVIDGPTLRDTVGWTCKLHDCERVRVSNLKIRNPPWKVREWSDGIDLCNSRHVLVEDCDITTGDDGVCLKSLPPPDTPYRAKLSPQQIAAAPVMHDILVRRCTIRSTCNATKIGTETLAAISRVTFEDITVENHPAVAAGERGHPAPHGTAITALSIQSNDGSAVSDITARRYRVAQCHAPIQVWLHERNRFGPAGLGSIDRIRIEDFQVARAGCGIQLRAGQEAGRRIGDVTLRDLRIAFDTDTFAQGDIGPPRGYPRPATLPSWALYASMVDGLAVDGCRFTYTGKRKGDAPRVFLVACDKVTGLDPAEVAE